MMKSTIWNAYSKEAVAFYLSPVTRPATVLRWARRAPRRFLISRQKNGCLIHRPIRIQCVAGPRGYGILLSQGKRKSPGAWHAFRNTLLMHTIQTYNFPPRLIIILLTNKNAACYLQRGWCYHSLESSQIFDFMVEGSMKRLAVTIQVRPLYSLLSELLLNLKAGLSCSVTHESLKHKFYGEIELLIPVFCLMI